MIVIYQNAQILNSPTIGDEIFNLSHKGSKILDFNNFLLKCKKHKMKIAKIEDLISYRLKNEKLIKCITNKKIKIRVLKRDFKAFLSFKK